MNSSPPQAPTARARWYILLVLLAAVTGFAISARTDGLFACQAASSGDEQYIGICNVPKYGDFDPPAANDQ